jgi:hypothetical protein
VTECSTWAGAEGQWTRDLQVIYRLEGNKLRWVSLTDALEHLGLTWKDAHVVDDKFLAQFESRPRLVSIDLDAKAGLDIERIQSRVRHYRQTGV